jgi:hypothetical protein
MEEQPVMVMMARNVRFAIHSTTDSILFFHEVKTAAKPETVAVPRRPAITKST